MKLTAVLSTKVVGDAIVATITVNAHGGFGHRRSMGVVITNTVNESSSSIECSGESGDFGLAVKCTEAFINRWVSNDYHRYTAEVSITRNGSTLTTVVSNHVDVKVL